MYVRLTQLVPVRLKSASRGCLLCILCCYGHAYASSDPFATESGLTDKVALYGSNPCTGTKAALDLPAVVHIALCNNPQTREVWANSQAQAAQVGVSQASYLPAISASVSGNQNSPGNSQRSASVNLSYLLYDFGARAANLESARLTLRAVNATQDSTVQSLFLSAVQAYYQTRSTQAAFEAAVISEQAALESFKVADARYQAGSATPADKLTARTAYSQATLNRISAQGAMKIAQGNLSTLLGRDANQNVNLVATQQTATGNVREVEQNVAQLIEQARQQRPDLQAAEATLKAAEATAEAARAAGKPTISLTAASNQSNSAGINTHGSSLGVNLSVPLFSGYAPTYRIRAAEAQIDTRKAQRERLRLQVALDVWTAYQNLATATQNLLTTADLLNSAEQAERMASGRYKAGAGIMLDLLNAQTTLAAARQQRIQSDLNWNISRAALAQAMGNLDTDRLQPGTEVNFSHTVKP